MSFILSLLYYTVQMSTPLLLCCIGGVFVQKAGTMNFALEAGINTGAFAAIVFTYLTGNLFIGIVGAILSCMLLNAIFGLFIIKLKANPTIVGLSLNMLIGAIPPFILSVFFPSRGYLSALEYIDLSKMKVDVPLLRSIPILSDIFNSQTPLTYITFFLIILLTYVFYKTKFGVYIQVTGENKGAAEAVGIHTNKLKWYALAISAATCALAGVNLSVELTGMFSLNIASARGLICLSAINCGKKKPVQSCLFGVLFGFSRALQVVLSKYVDVNTTELFNVIPYITIIIVFLVTEIPVSRRNTMRIFREA
jgi:ABC-type uncharacterized transport system permease subunit